MPCWHRISNDVFDILAVQFFRNVLQRCALNGALDIKITCAELL